MKIDSFSLSERQMARIDGFSLLAHGVPPVDDRRGVSGIGYVVPDGLQCTDAPKDDPKVGTIQLR